MNGFLYIAINKTSYPYTARSISKLKYYHPEAKIAVVADYPVDDKNVDVVINVPSKINIEGLRDRPAYPDQGFFGKVFYIYEKSPWENTIFFDNDTWITERVDSLFEILEHGYHIAIAHDIGMDGNTPLHAGTPKWLTAFNTGVIAFRKCQESEKLFLDWWKRMVEMESAWGDQPAFLNAIYHNQSIKTVVLPPEYNYRWIFLNRAYGKVIVFHGRAEKDMMENLERNINADYGNRTTFLAKVMSIYDIPSGSLK